MKSILINNKKNLVVILLGGAIVFLLFLVQPWMNSTDMEEELFSRYRLLLKYRSLVEESKSLGGNVDALRDELKSYEERLLEGSNTSLGFAELQRVVSGHVQSAGLKLLTVKPMPIIERDEYVEIPLQVDLQGDMKSFRDLVRKLEAEHLALRVSKLSISVADVRNPYKLNIKIAIHGMIKL